MADKKPIKITETVLRDAHQSLIATRMTTEQMLPIIDKMDKVGYHSVECWGGATFDASLRFLKEDPWERLRKLRDGFKNTKLQMLFRGQNILGYRHYADDVVEYFVQGYGWTFASIQGYRACTGTQGWFKPSNSASYTLHIRCSFNDIPQGCRGWM